MTTSKRTSTDAARELNASDPLGMIYAPGALDAGDRANFSRVIRRNVAKQARDDRMRGWQDVAGKDARAAFMPPGPDPDAIRGVPSHEYGGVGAFDDGPLGQHR